MTQNLNEPGDYQYGFDGMTEERMQWKMEKGWRSSGETPCGAGSELAMTKAVRSVLPGVMESFSLVTIADAGAGDMNWIPKVQWPYEVTYHPFDLVPRSTKVTKFDVTEEILEPHDLILCRHVLNHLSPKLALDGRRTHPRQCSALCHDRACHRLGDGPRPHRQ